MINALHLANFKAIGSRQRIPIRPLTLIYGANSAGKSSILHALALAHNAIQTDELDVHRTSIGGESIDLGGFKQYVHRRSIDRQVELAFELNLDRVELSETYEGTIIASVAIGTGFAAENLELFQETERTLTDDWSVEVERFELSISNKSIMSMSVRQDGYLHLDSLDYVHPFFHDIFRSTIVSSPLQNSVSEDRFSKLIGEMEGFIPQIWATRTGLFPQFEASLEEFEEFFKPFVFNDYGWQDPSLVQKLGLWLARETLEEIVFEYRENINSEILDMRYLGPLRSYPPRHIAFSQFHDSNRLAGGSFAWDLVRTDEEIRNQVNHWLGDSSRLKTPYELQIQELVAAHVIESQSVREVQNRMDELLALVEDIEDNAEDIDIQLASIRDAIEENSNIGADELFGESTRSNRNVIQDLVLIDKRTDTEVSHRDVGIGVSQVLPVLVSAFSSENAIVAIEQPEIHLHPALQTDLADVFIGSALGEQRNYFLVESHSEHLMLRILRRIRETTHRELPDNLPPITPEDVAVLYVQPSNEGVQVVEIPIKEDGEFDRPWPEGFFAERSQELF